jgi:hypothetical protein
MAAAVYTKATVDIHYTPDSQRSDKSCRASVHGFGSSITPAVFSHHPNCYLT